MIVTLTANPSIDVTLDVPEFAIDEVNRASAKSKDPAGKGINVARALTKNGVASVAIFPADDIHGAWVNAKLSAMNVETLTSPIADEIRQNITIVDNSGHTTKINEVGPNLSDHERALLTAEIESVLDTKPSWLVIGGSLPRGLDGSYYVELAERAHAHGVKVAIDTSGSALRIVAHAGVADLLKPNHEELEELAGHSLPTIADITDYSRSILRNEDAAVLVSLGEHGALLITTTHTVWANHAPVEVDSTVGAGDSSLAGYLSADLAARTNFLDASDALAQKVSTAVAWGAAAVQLPGTTVPGPHDITFDKVTAQASPNPQARIEEL
jgi:1-phosphofructokinase